LWNFAESVQVYIMLCIPLNTACCEWGFSIHTAVKTKIRSRTSINMLDSLLRIKCVDPSGLVDPVDGSATERERKAFMAGVTTLYQQREPSQAKQLHAAAAGLQVSEEDTADGSEGYDSECSIAASLDALDGCEDGVESEEEEEEQTFLFRAMVLARGEGEQGGRRCCLGAWATMTSFLMG
jgi:hypothetical protein